MEATRSGIARSAFQASQQAATMVVVAVKDAVREVVLAEELLACPYRVVQFQMGWLLSPPYGIAMCQDGGGESH